MKTALITGGTHRIGAQICQTLHQNNIDVIIHYRHSKKAGLALADKLNSLRANSARLLPAELSEINAITQLCDQIDSLDILVNNASVFYPTPIAEVCLESYEKITNTNLMAPLFLSTILAEKLKKTKGCIINIVDIHSQRPLKNHAIYNISKAGIAMMTKTLAKELAPDVRVCGVSPGSILWPENAGELAQIQRQKILSKIALKRQGNAQDIADAVLFLSKSPYITGQIITVDGGRTLNQ